MQCWMFHLHFMKASSAVVMQCVQTDDGTSMLLFCLRTVCHCRVTAVCVCVSCQKLPRNVSSVIEVCTCLQCNSIIRLK